MKGLREASARKRGFTARRNTHTSKVVIDAGGSCSINVDEGNDVEKAAKGSQFSERGRRGARQKTYPMMPTKRSIVRTPTEGEELHSAQKRVTRNCGSEGGWRFDGEDRGRRTRKAQETRIRKGDYAARACRSRRTRRQGRDCSARAGSARIVRTKGEESPEWGSCSEERFASLLSPNVMKILVRSPVVGREGRQGAMDSRCGGKRVDGGGVRGSEGGGARDGGGAWRRARAGGGSRFGGRSVGGAKQGDGGGPRRRGRAGRGSRFGEESHTRGAFGGKGGGAASGTALEAGDFFKARSFSLFALLSFFSFVFFTSANTPPSPPVCRRSEERRCREGEGVGIGGDGEAQGKACR